MSFSMEDYGIISVYGIIVWFILLHIAANEYVRERGSWNQSLGNLNNGEDKQIDAITGPINNLNLLAILLPVNYCKDLKKKKKSHS